jgi:hypothetical protein
LTQLAGSRLTDLWRVNAVLCASDGLYNGLYNNCVSSQQGTPFDNELTITPVFERDVMFFKSTMHICDVSSSRNDESQWELSWELLWELLWELRWERHRT